METYLNKNTFYKVKTLYTNVGIFITFDSTLKNI
jgi:hypothetical protein